MPNPKLTSLPLGPDTDPYIEPPTPTSTYSASTPSSSNSIRRFGDLEIESSMRKVLSQLPSNRSGAVVAYADKDGVRGAVYGRKPGKLWILPSGEWSYVGTLGVSYKGELDGTAAVMYSW